METTVVSWGLRRMGGGFRLETGQIHAPRTSWERAVGYGSEFACIRVGWAAVDIFGGVSLGFRM